MAGRPPVKTSWKPGQSGNPTGKVKGTKDTRTIMRAKLKEKGPELIQKVLDLADAGDTDMLKVAVSLILPKAREMKFAGGMGLAGKSIPEKLALLDLHVDNKELDVDVWNTMRQSYMREYEIMNMKADVEELKRFVEEIKANMGK